MENPSQDSNYNCLQLTSDYDPQIHPYAFLKDSKATCLINTKTMKISKIIDSQYDLGGYQSSMCQMDEDTYLKIFTLGYSQQQKNIQTITFQRIYNNQ